MGRTLLIIAIVIPFLLLGIEIALSQSLLTAFFYVLIVAILVGGVAVAFNSPKTPLGDSEKKQ